MTVERPTLLDIAKLNAGDAVVGLIDETTKATPEISGRIRLPGVAGEQQIPNVGLARTISGIAYDTTVRVALPTAGFRDANQGVDASKGEYENRRVQTFILNPRWEADKAIADRHEDGRDAFIALEAQAIFQAAMIQLGRQFYYGTRTAQGGHAKGFPGLLDALNTTDMEVDAGGSEADTGSSVWAVAFGPQLVQWVWGRDGALDMDDVRIESVTDADSKKFTAYVQELLAYPGVQVGSISAVGRIKKLTEDSGKGLTDDLLADLLSRFEGGIVPDAFFMTRRSLRQLRESRTATNVTGAPAPFPSEAHGVPILPTDSIRNDEPLTL